ncbi:MAG TPA: NAD(P)/FAD-dependent oxidoreductase [Candidatus Dormibacteraeota bacterium]|nr:NAD(P)/FAD-dependent oxidoreductase [Candidatus Dormibacteraeota bacterium]
MGGRQLISNPRIRSLDKPIVVLGAGPAGLTAAYELVRHGAPVCVIEKDPRYVGGIARTVEHNGYRFDIGGHRFFSKSQEVEDLWTELMGDEMLTRGRLSRIYYQGRYYDYPLKAFNALRNLGVRETVLCLSSYAGAKLRPRPNPKTLDAWVSNQFGDRLFRIFFKTYTEKVWGMPCSELSADWAAQRIKGLDLATVVKSMVLPNLGSRDRGKVVKTLIDRFRYPRLGPGQMWERVADRLREAGHPVRMGEAVVRLNRAGGRVASVTTDRGTTFTGSAFVSSLPIRNLVEMVNPPLPSEVRAAAAKLRYRDFLTVALVIDGDNLFPDNWVYIHDPDVKVGRIQNFKNWSPDMVADPTKTCIGLEYFCFEGDGLWSSTDQDLVELAKSELAQLGLCRPEMVVDGAVVRVPKAYPVYDDEYAVHVETVRRYIADELPNLHLVGRNGMHKYNNQDHSMMTALIAAGNLLGIDERDPWKVNGDAEYHEQTTVGEEDQSGRLVPRRHKLAS